MVALFDLQVVSESRKDFVRRWTIRQEQGWYIGGMQRYDPSVQEKIDTILKTVRDPESGLPLRDLNLVRKVRVSDDHSLIYLDVPFDQHAPGCLACAGIAMTIIAGIKRELTEAFENAFPGYTVEFV